MATLASRWAEAHSGGSSSGGSSSGGSSSGGSSSGGSSSGGSSSGGSSSGGSSTLARRWAEAHSGGSSSGGSSSGGSSGGSTTSSGTNTSTTGLTTTSNVVFVSDQYGNLRQTSGQPTQTIQQIIVANNRRSIDQARAQQTTAQATTNQAQFMSYDPIKAAEIEAYNKNVKTFTQPSFIQQASQPYGAASRPAAQTAKAQQEAALFKSEFYQKAEYPYTLANAGKYPVSSINKLQAIAKEEKDKKLLQAYEKPYRDLIKANVQDLKLAYEEPAIRRARATAAYEQIATQTISGFKQIGSLKLPTEWFRPMEVSPRFKNTIVGDIASSISSPFSITVAPLAASKGKLLAPLAKGWILAPIAAGTSYRTYKGVGEKLSFTPTERELLKQYESASYAGIRAQTAKAEASGMFNLEAASIREQKARIETEYKQEGISRGLTGAELTAFVTEGINKDYKGGVINIYKQRGYTEAEAIKEYNRIESGEQEGFLTRAKQTPIGIINPKAIANQLSLFFGDKSAYEKGVREELSLKGVTGSEQDKLTKLFMEQRNLIAGGEIAALAAIETSGQLTGTGIFRSSFKTQALKGASFSTKSSFSKLFKLGFKATAPAGFVEGFRGNEVQANIRGQEQNIKQNLIAGTIGAGTAGIFGGVTTGFTVTRPTLSKGLTWFGYALDPYEPVGDVLGAGIEKSLRIPAPAVQVAGKTVRFINPLVPTNVISNVFGAAPAKPAVSANIPTRTNKGQTTSITLSQIIGVPTNIPTNVRTNVPTNIPTFVPSNVPTNIPTDIFTNVNVEVPTEVPTFVPSNVPTNVPTMVTVPAITPVWRIPPPLPLGWGLDTGAGAGKGARKAGKAYLNELAEGSKLLSALTGGASFNVFGMGLTKQSKKKGRKK